MRIKSIILSLSAVTLGVTALSGCVPVLIGGAVGTTAFVTTDRRTTGAQMADEVMEKRIHYEISQAIPNNLHLTVTSYNRRILLTGEVGSESDKLTAQRVAQNSLEVSSVVNELMVGPVSSVTQRMFDSTLAGKVRTQLITTSGVSLNQMKVTVDRGIVYLMGLVTQEEAQKAADIASRVPGTKSVVTAFEVLSTREVQERLKLLSQPQAEKPAYTTTNNIVEEPVSSTEVRLQ
ncbi:BON domain-containing protein [Parasutterella secunda]|uniref:BON domain-containing protein n=1 Tax=Parasutterella secunda TaxID=626947 RepID=UPI0021AC132F|nr:BON domain-containing protein [Parasutterella secunda]MCR8920245.1 BON domain-containing protein [Parasutterella secunda]